MIAEVILRWGDTAVEVTGPGVLLIIFLAVIWLVGSLGRGQG